MQALRSKEFSKLYCATNDGAATFRVMHHNQSAKMAINQAWPVRSDSELTPYTGHGGLAYRAISSAYLELYNWTLWTSERGEDWRRGGWRGWTKSMFSPKVFFLLPPPPPMALIYVCVSGPGPGDLAVDQVIIIISPTPPPLPNCLWHDLRQKGETGMVKRSEHTHTHTHESLVVHPLTGCKQQKPFLKTF